MSKRAHLRIGQGGQQRNHIVHQYLIVNDIVLALFDQNLKQEPSKTWFSSNQPSYLYEIAKILSKTFPSRSDQNQWIIARFLIVSFGHFSNQYRIIARIHQRWIDHGSTSRTRKEELNQLCQGGVSIFFVFFDPLIGQLLKSTKPSQIPKISKI